MSPSIMHNDARDTVWELEGSTLYSLGTGGEHGARDFVIQSGNWRGARDVVIQSRNWRVARNTVWELEGCT